MLNGKGDNPKSNKIVVCVCCQCLDFEMFQLDGLCWSFWYRALFVLHIAIVDNILMIYSNSVSLSGKTIKVCEWRRKHREKQQLCACTYLFRQMCRATYAAATRIHSLHKHSNVSKYVFNSKNSEKSSVSKSKSFVCKRISGKCVA